MHYNKSMMTKQYTSFAGHFNGHADQAVQCQAHPPVRQVRIPQYGSSRAKPRCHHMPPLGKYSPCIAPADAMVIDFGSKNQVVAL